MIIRRVFTTVALTLTAVFGVTSSSLAQDSKKAVEKPEPKIAFNQASYDSAMLSEFAWRPIGPAVTSGRVVDLAVAEGPESRIDGRLGKLMYAAAASGGASGPALYRGLDAAGVPWTVGRPIR